MQINVVIVGVGHAEFEIDDQLLPLFPNVPRFIASEIEPYIECILRGPKTDNGET